MTLFLQLAVLFFVGSFGLWMAIPVGMYYDFSTWVIALTIIMGSTCSTTLVFIFGRKIKQYVQGQHGERYLGRSKSKMHRYRNKYGVIGLGLLLPGIFGPMIGMAVGITVVEASKRLLIWTLVGNVLWSILLAYAGTLGIAIF